jgi:acetyl-CoA decarbonylase/synthase complex subunit gamma
VAAAFLLLAGLGPDGYAWARVASAGVASALLWTTAALGSVILTAALLPWLPGRALSLKGLWVGLAMLAVLFGWAGIPPAALGGWLTAAAWGLIVPAVASFLAMNFTGATTYTSLSGVRREVRLALPVQIAAAADGVVLWLAGRYW